MRYWLTTHWPPELRAETRFEVWLQDKHWRTADKVNRGDKVVIVQARHAKPRLDPITGTAIPTTLGASGVVAIVEATDKCMVPKDAKPEYYLDGKVKKLYYWKFRAPTQQLVEGNLIPLSRLTQILGKKSHLHLGAGRFHGMEELSQDTFELVFKEFAKRGEISKYGFVIESDAHRRLKEFVYHCPSRALGEEGLTGKTLEYCFPGIADRADVILEDKSGNAVAVEVEVEVGDDEIAGILQAIKYKHMYAVIEGKQFTDVRGVLVAYRVASVIKEICYRYGIEVKEVSRQEVGIAT